MSIGKILVIAAAFTLGSFGAAMAADALVSVDGLNSIGDQALSEKHGKDLNIDIVTAESKQKLEQNSVDNSMTTVGGGIASGNATIEPGAITGFGGLGNFLLNTGNQNNLAQQTSLVVIVH
jgi:hypothetical protein